MYLQVRMASSGEHEQAKTFKQREDIPEILQSRPVKKVEVTIESPVIPPKRTN